MFNVPAGPHLPGGKKLEISPALRACLKTPWHPRLDQPGQTAGSETVSYPRAAASPWRPARRSSGPVGVSLLAEARIGLLADRHVREVVGVVRGRDVLDVAVVDDRRLLVAELLADFLLHANSPLPVDE